MSRAFVSPRAAFRAAVIFALLSSSVNTRAQVNPPSPAAPSTAPSPGQSDVPVREVVLFSSGVGYFQHQGTVQGDASAELRFKTNQINDILKSLVLQDLDGGHVGAVTYPSQDPLAKTLGSFQVDISDNPSLGDLLNKLRGARVSLAYVGVNGIENFPATILGVENRQVPGGKDSSPLEKEWLNLVTDKGIRSLELEKMTKIQLEDPGLQEELNKALAALAGARDQDKKPVVIRFGGQGERRVRLGYVVETPIWKASYRLILGDAADADAKDAKPKATLQGWAIVENQTDNDWNNVKLSLVSGRPISFMQDLYQPLYVPRPTVTPELYSSLKPQEYEGGQAEKAAPGIYSVAGVFTDPQFQVSKGAAPGGAPQPPSPATGGQRSGTSAIQPNAVDALLFGGAASPPGAPNPMPMLRSMAKRQEARERAADGAASDAPEPALNPSQSISSISDATKVGELFQYSVGAVSLPRQRSAMIPIINDPIDAEKLSIFNQAVLDKHPLNGARIKNNSADKKHLLAGPITVFEEGRYAGDAQIDNVAPGQERLLSYGIDLQVLVNVKDISDQQGVQTGKIVKGVLELTRKLVSTREYSAESKAERDKKLVVEHPLRQGWTLVNTLKPAETTEKLYRFERPLGAGKTEKLTVQEEYIQRQQLSLLPMDADSLLSLISGNGEIPQPVRDAAAKAASLKQAVAETQRQIDERKGQSDEIGIDQKRIRENIKTVDRTSEFGSEQTNKLKEQETQLNKLGDEIKALRVKLNEQQRALDDYLNGLNVG